MAEPLRFDDGTARALGFPNLLVWLSEFSVTEPGRRRLGVLRPAADRAELDRRFDGIEELRAFREGLGRLVPRGLPDPSSGRRGLERGDRGLDPSTLRDLAGFLVGAGAVARRADDLPAEHWPYLRGRLEQIPDSLLPIAEAIVAGVDADGLLTDAASEQLARIRRRQRRSAERLQRTLEAWMRAPGRAAHLQDTFVTQRNERFVVPVKTDASGQVAGIVHGQSSTGATRFVEPLETVELNNERVQLSEEEREEERRILREWQAALAGGREEIDAVVEAIAELDTLEGLAEFAARHGGCRPRWIDAGIEVEALRHPLLVRHLEIEERDGREVVPLQLELEDDRRVLLVSGPNAGGKTVVLKSLGLAVLMAQSGIPPLAARVRLPVFDRVFADVGDHQSIDEDLSTYSGHVRALRRIVSAAEPNSLLLIDEIGSGTDPAEGAALARAFLERFLRPGFLTVATTHHGPLKRWAWSADGVASAAMEFDDAGHRPTFRLIPGASGASAGLDVAERLGLPADLLARARALLGEHGVEAERFMRRLREALTEAERERDAAREERRRLEDERSAACAEAEREREAVRERAARRIESELEGFRREARKQLQGMRDAADRRAAQRDYAAREARMRTEQRRREGAVGVPEDDGRPPEALVPGMRVRVHSLAREGELVTIDGERARVRLGNAEFGVTVDDLRPAGEAARPVPPAARPQRTPAADLDDEAYPAELVLIGDRVADALDRLDRYLDGAARAGLREARIVHGHGTGRLRRAVREHLRGHALVGRVRPGRDDEGGDAATMATLR